MVALNHDGPRRQLVVVQRAAGHGRQNRIVVNPFPVRGGRQTIADDDRFERLPFRRGFRGIDVGGLPAVDRKESLASLRQRVAGTESELQLVAAAQVETAVLLFIELELGLDRKSVV